MEDQEVCMYSDDEWCWNMKCQWCGKRVDSETCGDCGFYIPDMKDRDELFSGNI